ncbi:MAG TPA: FkbM family methyltransferase [Thermoanaerobaculia bacterium]|nr:FkbM family methyltransferase [Thermoanaerobaculia bacterium]
MSREAHVSIKAPLKKVIRAMREVALTLATYRRGMTTTVNGVTMRIDARTRFSFSPVYDPGMTHLLSAEVGSGDECWNVGANVGVHVLQLAALVGPTGRVVAFEPNPEAASLLRRNIALNGFADRVDIVRAAVGQRPGITDFFFAGADPMGRPDKPNPLLSRTRRIRVPVTTLDELVGQRSAAPKCIVIDIEGWEVGALLGAESVLQLQPLPLLVFELHPDAWSWSGHSREQLEALIQKHRLQLVPTNRRPARSPLCSMTAGRWRRVEPASGAGRTRAIAVGEGAMAASLRALVRVR